MKSKTPEHLKPFEGGQLCFVVRRRYKGRGKYRLILHKTKALGKDAFSYGAESCWVVDAPKSFPKS